MRKHQKMAPDTHVRVVLDVGDEAALARNHYHDGYIQFIGHIDGAEIPVRFYRPVSADDDDRTDIERGCSCGQADFGAPGHDGDPHAGRGA